MAEFDDLTKALDVARKRRALLLKQTEDVESLIDSLSRVLRPLRPVETSGEPTPQSPKSVATKVLTLLQEETRPFTVPEILEEWERRGDPIKSADPKASLRTALSEAVKRGTIRRVEAGHYMAESWFEASPIDVLNGMEFLSQ